MSKRFVTAALALVAASGFLAHQSLKAQMTTPRVVSAAKAFLGSLDESGQKKVLFAFDDEQQRVRWSNLPVRAVPRMGMSLGEMSPAQRTAALALLAAVLSSRGYQKVLEIMDGDEWLRTNNGGNNPMFGKDLYYFSILGRPSETAPWMLQFGGHHLALNVTISGEQGILTPSLTAAQPALYTMNGKTVRPLGNENDKAFALLAALDETQQKQAVLNYRVTDLVLGPGKDGKTIEPEGLKATAMNDRQRAMLVDLISEWTGIVHDRAAAARMTQVKAGLAETWFAWSGPTAAEPGRNGTSYYRIQGPNLVIEYAPQRMGSGDPGMHIHTIYRDPNNDYGRKPAAR